MRILLRVWTPSLHQDALNAQGVSRSVMKRRSNVVYEVVIWSSPVRWWRMPGIKWYKRGQVPYIRALESLYFLPFLPFSSSKERKRDDEREVHSRREERQEERLCRSFWLREGLEDSIRMDRGSWWFVPFSPWPPPPPLFRSPPKNKRINRRFFMQTCI